MVIVLSQLPAPECCGKEEKKCLISGRNFEDGNNKDFIANTFVAHSWGGG